jgi:hypothetical protein
MHKLIGLKVFYPLSPILPQKPLRRLFRKLLDPRTPRILHNMFNCGPLLIRDRGDATHQIVELFIAGRDNRKSHLFLRIKAA